MPLFSTSQTRILSSPTEERLSASVITIGAFDGVHLGHQTLIKQATKAARHFGVPSLVYTFDPPPKSVFGTATTLTPLTEKIRRLCYLAPDNIIVANFDKHYASQPAEKFLHELSMFNPLEIWIGGDFRFGAGRKGDTTLLARYFNVKILPPVTCNEGTVISSSRIRDLIKTNKLEEAKAINGWPLFETPTPTATYNA